MRKVLIIFLVFICLPLAASEVYFPVELQGEWNENIKYCLTDLSDSSLTINAKYIDFYESQGKLISISSIEDSNFIFSVNMSNENSKWVLELKFHLSQDLSTLTDTSNDIEFTRYRCSGGKS